MQSVRLNNCLRCSYGEAKPLYKKMIYGISIKHLWYLRVLQDIY